MDVKAQEPTWRGQLRFRASDVSRLEATGLPIAWAKDTGTYLGVWGDGGLLEMATAVTPDGLELDDTVRYRDEPERFDEIWDTTRVICGGDDFLEPGIELPTRPSGAQWLVMDVGDEHFQLYWD